MPRIETLTKSRAVYIEALKTMSESKSPVISAQRITSGVAGYIWSSPCLKPLVFNPFVVSILILAIIWAIDFLYGKAFTRKDNESITATVIQHILTTYAIVAVGITLNNIIIKHHYRLEKANAIQEPVDESTIDEDEPLTSSYQS